MGGLSRFTNPSIIKNNLKSHGIIQGLLWKQYRGFLFIKFQDTNQASRAIAGMNGDTLNGRKIFVGFSKKEMTVKMYNEIDSQISGSESFDINLSVNHEINNGLKLSAIIIDKDPIKPLKMVNWLKSQSIAIRFISVWGLYAYIVQFVDVESFKRMTMGPTMNVLEFVEVIPMNQRRYKYSRFTRLSTKGIPFECCSSDCKNEVAKEFGRVIHVDTTSHRAKIADSLFALVGVCDPGHIKRYVPATISNRSNLWVEEIQQLDEVKIVSDDIINEYNHCLQCTIKAVEEKKRGVEGEKFYSEYNINSLEFQPEEGEFIAGRVYSNFFTPNKPLANGNITRVVHNSLEKVTLAVNSQKVKVDGIKNSLFTSKRMNKKDNRDGLVTENTTIPLEKYFSQNQNDFPTLSPKITHNSSFCNQKAEKSVVNIEPVQNTAIISSSSPVSKVTPQVRLVSNVLVKNAKFLVKEFINVVLDRKIKALHLVANRLNPILQDRMVIYRGQKISLSKKKWSSLMN
ncbi:uncharacterized protein [Rutidosis leptorrhynchoides]|uniref:uncharacterized protein n=1 Tax=Rutidosis leptorrhynchoides TaxID=125765 RepID=UPI003A998D28